MFSLYLATNQALDMKINMLLLILLVGNISFAQHVIVNADGTHSTVHSTGNGNGVIINSNGTHSTMHTTGNGSGIIVNPNGTHATFHSTGSHVKTIVNPNGTHSTLLSAGNDDGVMINSNNHQSYRKTSPVPSSYRRRQSNPKYTNTWWLFTETDSIPQR